MKMKEIINEAKNEIKSEVKSTAKGISSIFNIVGWIIGGFLIIGLFTGTLQNVVDNLFLKHYYIYELKSMDSPTGVGTLKDYVNSNFTNVEWDFERNDNEKLVTVSGNESGSEWKFYYSISDGYISLKSLTADGQPLTEYIDNKVDSLTEVQSEEAIEEPEVPEDYGTYKGNELGEEFYGNIRIDKLENKYDVEEIKEAVLDTKFIGTSNKIGKSLDKYLENITYDMQSATLGTSMTIKGYSQELATDVMINITITNVGGVYLSGIRQGTNNTLIDMPTQLKMADNIFN